MAVLVTSINPCKSRAATSTIMVFFRDNASCITFLVRMQTNNIIGHFLVILFLCFVMTPYAKRSNENDIVSGTHEVSQEEALKQRQETTRK